MGITSGKIKSDKEDGISSTYPLLDGVEEDDIYSKDGTVDYCNNPANKLKTGTWKACPYILGNECSERLAYYGMSSNLLLYFKHQLNEHSVTASKNRSNWTGACYTTPLIGAFIADAYLGRYWTIASFSIIYAVGMTLLTLSASVPGLKPICSEKDVCYATDTQTAVCFIAIYLVALGTGGIKPCVSSFGADQFDDADANEKKYKSSFFNWYYFAINIGGLIAHSVLVWVQDNVGWGWGFGIPTLAMAIAVVSFFSGTKLYRNQKPRGSPLTSLCQVMVASWRKRGIEMTDENSLFYGSADTEFVAIGSLKLDHTEDLSFFDKAAVELESDHIKGSIDPWRLCTVTQIEELKAIVRLLPIWATGIIFFTVSTQVSNLFVLQGSAMDIRVGNSSFEIPPASLGIFDTISVLFWVPVYDRLIVSVARKFTGHRNGLTQLQRIGTGLFISIFAMLSAAVLEVVRLGIVRRHNYYELQHMPNEFSGIGSTSALLWLARRFAILSGPTIPIIGEGKEEANDSYVEQLVASAEAAVEEVIRRGVAHPNKIAVGGHSYGAFMTANLLAHAPHLFCCGIARSGAYNRTLTPFGFQNEDRTLWEATSTYVEMSPFMSANKIKKPILLIHGEEDNNSGTLTMQSDRFFNALKGHGALCRLVILPFESHGYAARESIMHVLWESDRWLQKYCVSNTSDTSADLVSCKDDVSKVTVDSENKAVPASGGGGVKELENLEFDKFQSTRRSSL